MGRTVGRGGVALVLGNEARGLSPDVAAQVKQNARLPIVGKAESLNVTIAGGVLMYVWLRANLDWVADPSVIANVLGLGWKVRGDVDQTNPSKARRFLGRLKLFRLILTLPRGLLCVVA